jgi:hypothetical protein
MAHGLQHVAFLCSDKPLLRIASAIGMKIVRP